jgi:hypothetical protein
VSRGERSHNIEKTAWERQKEDKKELKAAKTFSGLAGG